MNVQAFDNFRANVQSLMETQGYSIRGFAEELETSHPYVINMLKGKSVPTLDRCEQIANILGIPLEKLIAKKI